MDWNHRWLLRGLLFYLSLVALIGGFAYVGYAQQSVLTTPGDGGILRFDRTGQAILGTGNLYSTGPAPVASACGGAGLAIVGSDLAGAVTVGSTPTTGCVITFALAFATAPTCNLTIPSGVLAAFSWVTTTTSITVTQTSTASNTINYICVGKQ